MCRSLKELLGPRDHLGLQKECYPHGEDQEMEAGVM